MEFKINIASTVDRPFLKPNWAKHNVINLNKAAPTLYTSYTYYDRYLAEQNILTFLTV